jgi:hypothetical protein
VNGPSRRIGRAFNEAANHAAEWTKYSIEWTEHSVECNSHSVEAKIPSIKAACCRLFRD